MLTQRDPIPALRPFVKTLWVADQTRAPRSPSADREQVLPTGNMHVAIRLSDHPLRLFDTIHAASGHSVGHAVVGGARSTPYVRDISQPACSVGVELYPGAARLLFDMPADELAERHTLLDELWGRSAALAREQLMEAHLPERQLDVLQALMLERLPRVRALHPAVAQALQSLTATGDVREAVKHSGYSHRRFIELFRQSVGLTPKLFCRVLRFRHALARIAANPALSWVDLATAEGYSDQAHFNRDFREFAGLTPRQYLQRAPVFPHHVPVHRPLR